LKEVDDGISLKVREEWFSEFTVREVWVVECEGPVEGWKVLEKIALLHKVD
jgi:hypothetical protein